MSRRHWLIGILLLGIGSVVGLVAVRRTAHPTSTPGETPVSAVAPLPPNMVLLSADKIKAAAIATTPVTYQDLQLRFVVPGRLEYDDTCHIEVKLPTDGILTEVRVKPGDEVTEGQVLTVLHSPEVGNARADVLKIRAEKELADRQAQWHQTTCDSLGKLVKSIRPQLTDEAFDGNSATQALGAYREKVISALTRYQLAQALVKNIESLAESGAVSLTMLQQRRSELQAADAALQSVMEQSLFEAQQACTSAHSHAHDAQRRLEISQQHVQTLLGYQDEQEPATIDVRSDLSVVEVRAPFAGTVESKRYSASERVQAGNTFCVLANTHQLWAKGDVRDRDWRVLQIPAGTEIDVQIPADPPTTLAARIYYVGREMDPQTNSVPIVATLDNSQGNLRPGQFVRLSLPVDQPRHVLAVPEAAVVQHGGAPFVFVLQTSASHGGQGDQQYLQVPVQVGATLNGFVEILSGVQEGQVVVSHGAFYLKSELMLTGTEE